MPRLFAVLALSFFMVGCEALWEEDDSDLPLPTTAKDGDFAPVAASTPAKVADVQKEPASPVMEVAQPSESETKFSWEAPAPVAPAAVIAPVVEAPKDPSKACIIEVRENLGLVAFVRSERPAVKSLLQLIKEGKVMVVEVASVNGTQVVANILPGQKNGPRLTATDIVAVVPQGSISGQ